MSSSSRASGKEKASSQIKIAATVLMLAAIALQIWQIIIPLPSFLSTVFAITSVVLIIHAVEGLIGAFLILQYKTHTYDSSGKADSQMLVSHLPQSTPLAVFKAGLYVFFVGTIGLKEIIKETKAVAVSS